MPEINVDVEVYCSCGEGLCNQTSTGTNRSGPYLTVEPCQKCLDKAKEEGKDEGYSEGKDEGYKGGREVLQSEIDAEKAKGGTGG